MCRAGREQMLCLMSVETRHIAIEVRLERDEISGRAGDGTDQSQAFQGWLGLLLALDGLLGKPMKSRPLFPARLVKRIGRQSRALFARGTS